MAKLSTKNAKLSDKENAMAVANAAHAYVQNWARDEAQKLAKKSTCIIPASWGLQVGRFAVKQTGGTWTVYNCFDEAMDAFTCKQSAVVFSLLQHLNKINMARDLQNQDNAVLRIMQDLTFFSYRRAKAVKVNDGTVIDIIDARIQESNSKLHLAREELEKTLNKAKYLKDIWEQPL